MLVVLISEAYIWTIRPHQPSISLPISSLIRG